MNLNKIIKIDTFITNSKKQFYFQRNYIKCLLKNVYIPFCFEKNNVILKKVENKYSYLKVLNSIFFSRQKGTGTLKCEYGMTPLYFITFTCKRCSSRTTHKMTKQAYHNGTVIIQCPNCKNRHLISDHLRIFSDKSITIEDIMREKGENIYMSSKSFVDNQAIEFMNNDIQLFLTQPKK
ncbi:hypothetical protein PORY_002343 [Pneumocystis oryctolagi]|uniref:Uncharacterized protein n=1 Tax=Pneumocystis oryctolagi TaxID=42067 RepID=A0ACB7CAS7_9ASCO|nr:hypothetical protein PORY_002343 [Pneumocystis oryctolagi]